MKLLVLIAVPLIICIQFTADFLYPQVFGNAYIRSAVVEKILCFILLIAPVGYLLGSRVMLVSGNERLMVICVSIGAVVNTISNYFLIQVFGEIGAAMASVISELVVAEIYVNFGRRVFRLFALKRNFMNVGLAAVAMLLYLTVVSGLFEAGWLLLFIQAFGSFFTYAIVLVLLKDSIFCDYGKRLLSRL